MRIAIVTDTHVNPTDTASSSVYKVHANANPRLLSVVAKINAMGADLVVHMGDTVHRIQGQPQRAEAVARYHAIMDGLDAPRLQVAGNHDEGEKSTPWACGHPVSPENLVEYRREFGADHFVHDVGEYRLIILNSQLYGLGTEAEAEQKRMLVEALAGPQVKFIFQHHPFFLESIGEREHYDNLPPEVRDEYLPLILAARVHTVFAGHVHNYFYNKIEQTRFFVVPSTTFVRHDFTEFFPFVPQDGAHGRNYASKLGFFTLELDGAEAVFRWFHTDGHEDPLTAADAIQASPASLFAGDRAAMGIDLRHDWATPIPIPYTQLQDEFNRKHVRNDYITAALVETAIHRVRIPIQDLEEPKPAKRLAELADLGLQAMVFLFRAPTPAQVLLLNQHRHQIDCLECCAPEHEMAAIASEVRGLGLDPGIPVAFSAFGTSVGGAEPMAHYIWTGFDLTRPDLGEHLAALEQHGFDAVVVRVERNRFSFDLVCDFARRLAGTALRGIVYARLASLNGAEFMGDDTANAAYVASLAVLAHVLAPNVQVFLDTFADHDRGYYPRNGLTDRAYDLRPAGHVVANLAALLGRDDHAPLQVERDRFVFQGPAHRYVLVPDPRSVSASDAIALLDGDAVEAFELARPGGTDMTAVSGADLISRTWGASAGPVLLRGGHLRDRNR